MERKKWEGSGKTVGWKWQITGQESEEQKKWIGVKFKDVEQQAEELNGMKFVNLEDYLEQKIRHPIHRDEAVVLNGTEVLRLLGISTHSTTIIQRAQNWLVAHRFERHHGSYNFKVALVDRTELSCIIV
jgi:hypothetical protein